MIKRPCTLALTLSAVLCLAAPLLLSAARTAPAPRFDTPLEQDMQNLQAGFKALDKALGKQDAAAALDALHAMETAVVAARGETPSKAADISDAKEQAAFTRGFHLKLIELQRALLDVEAATLEGKIEEARKLLDQNVKALKKAGHDAYKAD